MTLASEAKKLIDDNRTQMIKHGLKKILFRETNGNPDIYFILRKTFFNQEKYWQKMILNFDDLGVEYCIPFYENDKRIILGPRLQEY